MSIVRHRREPRRSCSLTPLEPLPDYAFHTYPGELPSFADHVRLGFGGSPLSPADRPHPILVLDATWKRVPPMVRAFEHVPPRSLPRLVTAYPRVSKLVPDPVHGLASIEALIVATHILGGDPEPLWARYAHADLFRERNAAFFS